MRNKRKSGRNHAREAYPREYVSWCSMLTRVRNPKRAEYENYGGRGITVCPQWSRFRNFIADVGPKPTPLHTLDRIDNDGNYEPGNVRWATRKEQNENTRRCVYVTAFGLTQPLRVWAVQCGVTYEAMRQRIHGGNYPTRPTLTHALRDWSPWGEAFPA